MEPGLLLLLLLTAPWGRGWATSRHASGEMARTDRPSVRPGECQCVPVRAWSQSHGIRGRTSHGKGNRKKSQHSPRAMMQI